MEAGLACPVSAVSALCARQQEKESYVRELEELLPQLEGLMAEKEAREARVAALQREAGDASQRAQQAHAQAVRAQEVSAVLGRLVCRLGQAPVSADQQSSMLEHPETMACIMPLVRNGVK